MIKTVFALILSSVMLAPAYAGHCHSDHGSDMDHKKDTIAEGQSPVESEQLGKEEASLKQVAETTAEVAEKAEKPASRYSRY